MSSGAFERAPVALTERITSDGSSHWPVEAGRYRLIAARACPWASRAVIVRRLLGLEDAISLGIAGPLHDERSWRFHNDPGNRDPVLGIEWLGAAYEKARPGYDEGVTVPTMVEVATGRAVSNNFQQLTLDFSTQWRAYHRPGAPDLYPVERRAEIDEVIEGVYRDVNNGVYRCGFASSQQAYERAYDTLFARLDALSERLATRRYLVGDTLTEADVRLWVTLVRFDPVYHGHFKCNRQKLTGMPVLWAYARDLFQTPGFGDTTDFAQIKQHYYGVHAGINPSRVVPKGPDLADWLTPHGREELGGGRSATARRRAR
jgi:glutathionyl-hydroquinone reductase